MEPKSRVAVLFTLLFVASLAAAQAVTGTPRFASLGGGPFDTVNLGNLNVHFAIPVLNKPGRGLAFNYNLVYDSSIWIPVTSNGTTAWTPANNANSVWGWTTSMPRGGYFTYSQNTPPPTRCGWIRWYDPTEGWQIAPQYDWTTTYNNFAYYDGWGTRHPFPGSTIYQYTNGTPGPNCPQNATSLAATASDSSGYTISLTDDMVNSLTAPNGVAINTYFGAPTPLQDNNGNKITYTTLSGTATYTDTLGTTALAVSGGSPNPVIFQYTAPSGATASYTMNYAQYTVKTNFGVSGVQEYGPLANSLVSNIQLPDGSQYQFTYEVTPGTCTPLSGTYSQNCVTGRIASIVLPTGGQITYTYTDGSNGIEHDGSTAGLNRTLTPGGEWQYSRTLVSGTPGPGSTWTTTVTDPNGNNTVIYFAEDSATTTNTTIATYSFYETERQVKQLINGSQTVLLTTISCYNAHYASCAGATVGSPITQKDFYTQLPNGSTRLSEVVYNTYGLVTDDKQYNYGVATGAAPGTTKLIRETILSYSGLGSIVNKPSSIITKDWTTGSAVTLASSTFGYDQTAVTPTTGTPQHVSTTGSHGNLTTLTTSTSSTASLSKTFTYYDTGNPNVVTDVNSAQTTYVYSTGSCGNSFPTTVNEPLSLSRSMTWNCTGGVVTQVTDENGNTVTSDYSDPDFWRPDYTIDQMGNQTNIMYIGENAVETALQNFNSGNSAFDFRTTVDGFGRPILKQHLQSPGGNQLRHRGNGLQQCGFSQSVDYAV